MPTLSNKLVLGSMWCSTLRRLLTTGVAFRSNVNESTMSTTVAPKYEPHKFLATIEYRALTRLVRGSRMSLRLAKHKESKS
jgi:hypothetical protein